MINRRELAICKRRGHAGGVHEGWTQCKWCKTWLREVRKIEQRESEPPEAELDIRVRTDRTINRLKHEAVSGGAPLSKKNRGPKK